METVTLSFPGLGIDEFTINKIIFSIGDKITVRWYALCLVLGIIAAYVYSCRRAKTNGLTSDDMTDVALWTIIAGVIGARIYFVLSRLDQYDSFWEMCKIWKGGIGIYGALIGGGLALFICCKVKKISWRAVFDTVAPGVLIAQGIGRWGNFFNGEAYGVAPAEDSLLYFLRMTVKQGDSSVTTLAQPCFFYESLWCVLGFVLINVFYKKFKKYDGQIFFEYVLWYSFGRFFIEGLRTDSLYLFNNESLPRKSQALALILVIVSAACLVIFGILAHKKKLRALAESAEGGAYGELLAEREENAGESAEAVKAEEAVSGETDKTPAESDAAADAEETADETAKETAETADETAETATPEEEKSEDKDDGTDN